MFTLFAHLTRLLWPEVAFLLLDVCYVSQDSVHANENGTTDIIQTP